jgi:hypothetical protein
MAKNGESKASERRIAAIERQRQAMELRKGGLPYHEIARRLGYEGPPGAYQAVMRGLRSTLKEPAEELRKLEVERLNQLFSVYYTRGLQGDLKAAELALRISARRAAIEGLDAPQRHQHSGDDDAAPIRAEVKVKGQLDLSAASTEDLRLIRDLRNRMAGVPGPGSGNATGGSPSQN